MKRVLGCVLISFSLLQGLAFGADPNLDAERLCAATYGTTGAALPKLIQEAIKVFPADRYSLKPTQVVYVDDFNGFVDCLGIADVKTRNFLFRQALMVFHYNFPIYVNRNDLAIHAFDTDRQRSSYLKYVFASYLGFSWIHAKGETKDSPAYAFELSLIQSYRKLLPATDRTEGHINEVKELMAAARAAEENGRESTVYAESLIPRSRD